eukprot:716726-Rhodomonas_salina.1
MLRRGLDWVGTGIVEPVGGHKAHPGARCPWQQRGGNLNPAREGGREWRRVTERRTESECAHVCMLCDILMRSNNSKQASALQLRWLSSLSKERAPQLEDKSNELARSLALTRFVARMSTGPDRQCDQEPLELLNQEAVDR